MINSLTIDIEDYFQVSAFERCVSRDCWDRYSLRVEDNTKRILDILDEYQIHGTFFILGWIAEKCPSLVKNISIKGHEIASHGFGHQRIYNQTRTEFRDDIRKSKAILEEITGGKIYGYRAPSYSISMDTLWAYDELLEAGYLYDSSVFPIQHDLYGIPNWPRFPFTIEKSLDGTWMPKEALSTHLNANIFSRHSDKIVEFPITTFSMGGKNIPIAGGGYFRLFPYPFTRWGLRRINRGEGCPFVFYLHPWELDPNQPRINGASPKSRFRHYLNLQKTESRLKRLLNDFSFASINEVFMYKVNS
jgi:polysaccharide deacetylase family protein (PEP-CTERM system associated)